MTKQTFTTGQVLTASQLTSLQQTAMGGGSTTAKTASYTLVALDAGTVVQMNSASATTITVNTALFAAGDTVQIQNVGAGVLTVTAGTATVSTAGSLALSQYENGQLYFNTTSAALFFDVMQSAGTSAINKNYLINGGFAISQRGTSFTASDNNDDAYTLDRFYILSDGNDIIDVTQNTATVPTNGQFAIALDVETVNKKFGIATIIENKDCIGLIGNTVTFSFKAKVSATTQLDNVKCAIVAWSGTADTVTSDIISAWGVEGTNPTLIANATYENTPENLNLTTSYASYSVSAAVDTASTTNLILFIWSDVTTTTLGDFLFIAESKLELGSSATAFEYAGGTIQGELAACQRYYQLIASGTNKPLCPMSYPSASNVFGTLTFAEMRTAPTLVVASGTDYYTIIAATGTNDNLNAFTITYSSTRGILINNNSEASNTAGFAGQLVTNHASASVALNSEL